MPKKTKKQKMAAEKRKSEPQIHHVYSHVEANIPVVDKVISSPKTTISLTNVSNTTFKKELSKSLLISISIIVVEIAIYLAQNKGISFTNFLSF